jgi:hypothetical protein
MKHNILYMLLLTFFVAACTPSQKVTSSWMNRDALPTVKRPFHSILILAMTENVNTKNHVEEELAKIIRSRGQKALKSSDVFIPKMNDNSEASRNLIKMAIAKSGCEAVFTVALLNVKNVETYQPGRAYYPMGYGYYGSYADYYGHFAPVMYDPGYYVMDQTYYVESNFYDIASGQLLYSVQSAAFNPSSLESWFKEYSRLLISQMKTDQLITK